MILYKYRSLANFKNFVDIVLNSRLYAAPYFDMNDPMEGHYVHSAGTLSGELVRSIKGEKERLRICSLSETRDNPLMWAHYADGHRGVCIGVAVDEAEYDVRSVDYVGPSYVQNAHHNGSLETAKRILCHKYDVWHYEREHRAFVTGGAKFASIEVKEVWLGSRMGTQDKGFVTDLLGKICPAVIVRNSDAETII